MTFLVPYNSQIIKSQISCLSFWAGHPIYLSYKNLLKFLTDLMRDKIKTLQKIPALKDGLPVCYKWYYNEVVIL